MRIGLQALLDQERQDGVILGQGEFGGHAGLAFAGAHQPGIGPAAQRQAQGIEQDGLAGAGLAGQRRQPGVERDVVTLWAGPGFHIVHYPLRHGTLFNVVAVFRRSAHSERGDTAAYRAELQQVYRDAHPTMKALLAMLDLGRRQAVGDRDPVRHWHRGRVVLLGDAAHPTLQSLAQGACMAIEDGLCLADCIDGAPGDHAAAFQRYERARGVRTARVTLESRYLWDVYHAGGIAREVYFQMLGERSEADTFQCLSWLYDGVAPDDARAIGEPATVTPLSDAGLPGSGDRRA